MLLIQQEKQTKIKKLQTFDLSCFNGRRYFDDDEPQNYVVFQPVFKTYRMTTGDDKTIATWKLKGLSD